jgi:activating signal cointegrator complex subunit 1
MTVSHFQGTEGDVSVAGPSTSAVRGAHSRVTSIVDSARLRQEATHFVSLPVNTPEMQSAFESFK